METVTDFIFLGSKITADGDCSHKIKISYSLEGKLWPSWQQIKKQRHYFVNKGPSSQGYGFSMSTGIDAFEVWCWRRLLRVPWTARRSYQSIVKEISPEYSMEGLMVKLKHQYFDHVMWRSDSFEKTPMLGNTEGGRRRGQPMVGWHHWLNGHEFE